MKRPKSDDFGEPFDVLRAVSGSAEQFGPELTAEGLTVEAPVEPLSRAV